MYVLTAGLDLDVNLRTATYVVVFMGNAKMVHVCASPDGMGNIAHLKVAQMNVGLLQSQDPVGTESVKELILIMEIRMVIGGPVSAMRGGKEKIAVLN